MRLPIKALKELANKYKYDVIVTYAWDEKNEMQHIATWGRTIKQSDQAAQWADLMKDALGWPEKLKTLPSRVKKWKEKLKGLETFHPRAMKLMNKKKGFVVVAEDEPYFESIYTAIRYHEKEKGTWTEDDEKIFLASIAKRNMSKEKESELNDRYVDHLCIGLEERSVASILDFLARYVGWIKILKYVTYNLEEVDKMGRLKNKVPSRRIRLDGYIKQPITDPKIQKTVDWLQEMSGSRKAFPMAFELLVAAVNGEIGEGVQVALQEGDTEKAHEAIRDLMGAFG